LELEGQIQTSHCYDYTGDSVRIAGYGQTELVNPSDDRHIQSSINETSSSDN